jgi:LuxR family maltose regulon positive regulatory protein
MTDYVSKLLVVFEEKGHINPSSFTLHPLLEPLSERELELLRLIADGLSNQEIAQKLIIALGTVKAHTASIYGKLDVHSRTQAVARARELKLL